MKKIIIVFNGIHFPAAVVKHATEIACVDNSLVYGIFINSLKMKQDLSYQFPNDLPLTQTDYTTASDEVESQHLVEAQIKLFQDECFTAGVLCKTKFYHQTSVKNLIIQSAYADLIIADTKTDFNDFSIHEILAGAHCPVYLVKPRMEQVQQVTLAFDGSLNSMHAIKQYSYLLPHWNSVPTSLLTIINKGEQQPLMEDYMTDWLAQHFKHFKRETLPGEVKEVLSAYIQKNQNVLVVMGAFGRNAISRWMHKSMADVVVKETGASLFITHL